MAMDGKAVVGRYDRLKSLNNNNLELFEEIAQYVDQSRMGMVTEITPGDRLDTEVFDSTASNAGETLANFLFGQITNPAQKWGSYKVKGPMSQVDAVREWSDEITTITLENVFASNFYAESPEFLKDWSVFGTGQMFAGERSGGGFGLMHKAERIGRYVIDEDFEGKVDTRIGEFRLSVRAAANRFGIENLSDEARRAAESQHDQDKRLTFICAVMPREEKDRKRPGALGFPWASAFIEHKTKHVVEEGGYRDNPYLTARFKKTPNELFGRGIGTVTRADIKTLNKAKQMDFQAWALNIKPPILGDDDSIMGNLRWKPASWIGVKARNRDVRGIITPLNTGSRFDVSQIQEGELRAAIEQAYYVKQIFELLQVEKSQMTAFEFARKLRLAAQILGAFYGRLLWEFLNPLWERWFTIQFRAGQLPDPPDELLEVGGEITAVFDGPLARAQREDDAVAAELWLQDVSNVAQINPNAADYLNVDEYVKMMSEIRGAAGRVVRDDDEVAALREARAKMQQQQMQQEQLKTAGQVASQVAPLLQAQ